MATVPWPKLPIRPITLATMVGVWSVFTFPPLDPARYSDIPSGIESYKNIQETHRADKRLGKCKTVSNQERKSHGSRAWLRKFFQFLFIKDHGQQRIRWIYLRDDWTWVFVELEESHVEGFIPFDSMEKFYAYWKQTQSHGSKSGLMLTMGDKIRIKSWRSEHDLPANYVLIDWGKRIIPSLNSLWG